MIRVFLTLLFAANVPLLLFAQGTPPRECSSLVTRVFEVAGVNDEVAAIPAQIQGQIPAQFQHDARMSDADKQKLTATMTQAFLPEKIDRQLKQEFFKTCDLEMLRAVVAGLTTPLGVRMRALEAFTENPKSRQQGEEYAHTLQQHPPARDRVALILRMDASLGITKSALDMNMASARGIAAAFGGLPADGSVESALGSKQVSDNMHGAVLVNLLFTYRDVSDQDLTSYIQLYETPVFMRFNDTLEKAFLAAIARQSDELGQDIKKIVPPAKGQTAQPISFPAQ
jgi:hypothetical protein